MIANIIEIDNSGILDLTKTLENLSSQTLPDLQCYVRHRRRIYIYLTRWEGKIGSILWKNVAVIF